MQDGAEGEGAGQSSNGAVVTDAWRCLGDASDHSSPSNLGLTGIKFAIEWPLHLLFEGEVAQRSDAITTHHWLQVLMQYNQLFGFLFLVRRVDAALHAAWAPQVQLRKQTKEHNWLSDSDGCDADGLEATAKA